MSGLCKEDLRIGEGATAEPGDRCTVRFTGWLPGAREPFDSTPDASEPFVFRLQEGAAIQGFVEGIAGMRVGGRRRLLIPSALAYGEEGRDEVIPPGSDLIFEVELVCVVKRQSDTRRLLIAPQARVRWHGKTVELYVPGEPRTVESEDAQVLLVLHEFSIPSHPTEVAGRFPELPPESVEAAVDELEAAHVLIQEAGRTGEAPTELVQAASHPAPIRFCSSCHPISATTVTWTSHPPSSCWGRSPPERGSRPTFSLQARRPAFRHHRRGCFPARARHICQLFCSFGTSPLS